MSDHQKHREAMSGKCLEAMSAKGRTFRVGRHYPVVAVHHGGSTVGDNAAAARCWIVAEAG